MKIYSYRNQVDQIRRYVQGGADAVAVTLGDTLLICAKVPDRCPVIVFVVDESRGGDQLLALPGFDTLSLLRNQPIGLENSALAIYLIHRFFERYELDPPLRSQLHFLPQESFQSLLKSGAIKAVLTYPPTSSLLQESLDLQLVVSTRDLPGEVLDVLAVAPDFLRRHPQAVAALIDGWRQAREQEQDAPDEVMVEMAALMGIHPDELRSEKKGLLFPGPQEQYQMLSDRRNNLLTPLRKEKALLERVGLIGPGTPLPRVDSRFIFKPSPGS